MSDEDFILYIQVLAMDAGRRLSIKQAKEMADTVKNAKKLNVSEEYERYGI